MTFKGFYNLDANHWHGVMVFAVHDISYYQKAFDIFSPSGACVLLGAFHDEKPLA